MTDKPITFVDKPPSGNSKYPKMLKAIKAEQLERPEVRGKWAVLNSFDVPGSARDLVYRLTSVHTDFEFSSSRDEDTGITVVLVRLKDEVTQ